MDMIMGIATREIVSAERTIIEGGIVYAPIADLDDETVRLGLNCCQASTLVVERTAVDIEPRWRELRQHERDTYTRNAQRLLIELRDMSDSELLDVARRGQAHATMVALYPDTNPVWFVSTAAVEAYERGVIDEIALDSITG